MSVVEAVEAELGRLRERAPGLAVSSLAATALVMARELDDASNSATSKSMCSKEFRECVTALWALAPPAKQNDEVDEIRERRNARRRRAAAE